MHASGKRRLEKEEEDSYFRVLVFGISLSLYKAYIWALYLAISIEEFFMGFLPH